MQKTRNSYAYGRGLPLSCAGSALKPIGARSPLISQLLLPTLSVFNTPNSPSRGPGALYTFPCKLTSFCAYKGQSTTGLVTVQEFELYEVENIGRSFSW